MNRFSIIIVISLLCSACTAEQSKLLHITISDTVINAGYIGNGAEWDPYDEALCWGSEISEEDWQKLYTRLDFMKMGYVRCMINSPFTYYNNGSYDKNRNTDNLIRLLNYCQANDVYVIFGEYNPPTWEMKDSQEWIDMSVDFLADLVLERGFDCIKQFVIFNEPDGNWASTNGDYTLWLSMLRRFDAKMSEYNGLREKVSFAGPDVVLGYKNSDSPFDAEGWVKQSSEDADELIGIYDVHAYPGQAAVQDGSYAELLKSMADKRPADKKIVLGEAGYKYQSDARDAALWAEYCKRVEGHPFTKGSDCNMLVYDYFYGLDMPLLAMEAMNAGYSGLAVWMLDDAMHSSGDSGKTEDIKIWGMWNTLGAEVFGDASQEEVRPWYYTWSLMCRYFPRGCDIVGIKGKAPAGVRYVAALKDGKLSVAAVNVSDSDFTLKLALNEQLSDAKLYLYKEGELKYDGEYPAPVETGISGEKISIGLPAQSFVLLSDYEID